MPQQLSKRTRDTLAQLFTQAAQMGRTHNGLDEQRAAYAIRLLNDEYGIKLGSLQRAEEILKQSKGA